MPLHKLKNIFIIEDNAVERGMMTDFLSRYKDTTVKGFFSGDACIKEIVNGKSATPDLVLIDYFLDSMAAKFDGLDTLVKVIELCPKAKVVMFTGVENERVVELAKAKGAIEYIVKGEKGFSRLGEIISENFDLN